MNKITRKSFLKVLAATMVGGAAASTLTGAAAPVSIDETNGKVSRWVKNSLNVIEGSLYLGEIKNVSMDESILGEDGELDLTKFVPITYDPIHHGYYPLGQRVGNAFADGAKLK